MSKITVVMVINQDNYHIKSIQNIIKKNAYDFEIIFINKSSDNLNEIKNKFHDDKRIIIKELNNNNLMQTLNDTIIETESKYIIFTNSLNILSNNKLKRAYNKLEDTSPDILMFNQNNKETTIISRIVGFKTFTYEKISDYLFTIDLSLEHFVYDKNYLIKNNIKFDPESEDNSLLFSYKCILEANKIVFFDEILDIDKNYSNQKFNDYLKNLEKIKELFIQKNNPQLTSKVNNYYIKNSIQAYERSTMTSKKETFLLLRNNYINILQSENIDNYLKTLNKINRKLFEQVIISESVEEYELLRKVSKDRKHINYMKRYKKILKVEHTKINNFNKSLISSNSWKLTKFLRIREKL